MWHLKVTVHSVEHRISKTSGQWLGIDGKILKYGVWPQDMDVISLKLVQLVASAVMYLRKKVVLSLYTRQLT